MDKTLYSSSWYRVANLKPLVRRHAEIHRHTYRGKVWYVLQDHSTGRFHRFTEESYFLIGLMDGKRTLQEIWESACLKLADDMPTQDEVIGLVSQLNKADVLQSDTAPDVENLNRRSRKDRSSRFWNTVRSPLAIRIPLLDPDRFLEKTKGIVGLLFTMPAFLVWLIVVVAGAVLASVHWNELVSNLADRVLALENLVIFWLIYPIVKALHEFGHAWAVKHWGGEVHEMGIIFLVFMPIPYVDASATSAFREKRRRIIVGAAGIMVELLIAALAMILWVNTGPGAVRAVAYNTMIVAGVSTILFNGNPLLRFDAYYVLSDFLEIPNLGSRSNQYIGYLAQRYAIGNKEAEFAIADAGEGRWLVLYGVASFFYRIFITLQIALFIAGRFFFIGVVIAIWAVIGLMVVPLFRIARSVVNNRALYRRRGRIVGITVLSLAIIGVLVGVVRLPSYTVAEGVLWPAEQARLHARVDGEVKEVLAKPGVRLKKGDPILRCENPDLVSRVQALEAEMRSFGARQRMAFVQDRTTERMVQEELARVAKELAEAREQVASLVIRSPIEGEILLPRSEDLPGRFLRRGEAVGYVVDYSGVAVRVVVPQSEVDRIRTDVRSVKARPAEDISRIIPSELVREVPAATGDLPSYALSLKGGGAFALDPRATERPRSFENLFHFEVRLQDATGTRIGERIYVRFEHTPESLAHRWYREIRGIFLKRFEA
ncbi:MAG: peptidase M50 [Deltaproteobacteria bacterium HGW-Deltaproteobacteria-19]|nr:MAG: peptidase M50 [Deltaproteobacteria bacterium HGW-Deltaproteobacteria-19]